MRILLVEDSEDEAVLVQRALGRRPDWKVEHAANVQDARRLSRSGRFDIALVDYRLPDGSGLDVLALLHQADPALPVLFLTGYGSEDLALQAMSLGAADYMVKGADKYAELPDRVVEVAKRRGARASLVTGTTHGRGAAASPTPGRAMTAPSPRPVPALEPAFDQIVQGSTMGVAVFDPGGRSLAARGLPDSDLRAIGELAASLSSSAASLGRLPSLRPNGHVTLLQTASGLVGLTAVPGPLVVALVLDPSVGQLVGMKRLQDAARLVRDAMG